MGFSSDSFLQDRKTIAGSVYAQLKKSLGKADLLRIMAKKMDPLLDDYVTSCFSNLKGHQAYWNVRKQEILTMIL